MQVQPVVLNGDAGGDFEMNDVEGFNRVHVLSHLSPEVRKRVAALRKLQIEGVKIEAEFYKAMHDLDVDFQKKFSGLYARRRQLVNGESEPNEEEASFPLFNPGETELVEEFKKQCTVNESKEPAKGVPEFWLETFRHFELVGDMIQENDEEVLKSLTDVTMELTKDPMSFTLSFHFAPNDYFTNTVLTKKYMMKCEVDDEEPAEFDGPEIYKCEGCKIDWKEGKDVTKKLIKKKQKNKKNPAAGPRFVTKEVKADSFFNFFDPATNENGIDDDMDEADKNLLSMDFEIGQMFRDTLIPHALFHFTGETEVEDDDFDEDEEDDMEDEDDDDEDEE